MTRTLIRIILASVLLSIILGVTCHLAFLDVLPYAAEEDETISWRRQLAFLLTATAWLSAEFAGILIVLAAHLWKRHSKQQLIHCPGRSRSPAEIGRSDSPDGPRCQAAGRWLRWIANASLSSRTMETLPFPPSI